MKILLAPSKEKNLAPRLALLDLRRAHLLETTAPQPDRPLQALPPWI